MYIQYASSISYENLIPKKHQIIFNTVFLSNSFLIGFKRPLSNLLHYETYLLKRKQSKYPIYQ